MLTTNNFRLVKAYVLAESVRSVNIIMCANIFVSFPSLLQWVLDCCGATHCDCSCDSDAMAHVVRILTPFEQNTNTRVI